MLPIVCLVLLAAGRMLEVNPGTASFFVGGTTLLLVFIGIHNAWDTVTFLATGQGSGQGGQGGPSGSPLA